MELFGFYDVAESRPLLKTMLKQGGSAILTIGNEYRLLMHIPSIDRSTLPWPLSLIQPRRCVLQVYELLRQPGPVPEKRGTLIREREYVTRSEHAAAIEHFLDGAKSDDSVSIDFAVSN